MNGFYQNKSFLISPSNNDDIQTVMRTGTEEDDVVF